MGGFLNAVSKFHHHHHHHLPITLKQQSAAHHHHHHSNKTPCYNVDQDDDGDKARMQTTKTATIPVTTKSSHQQVMEEEDSTPTTTTTLAVPVHNNNNKQRALQQQDDSLSTSDDDDTNTNIIEDSNVEKVALQSGDVWFRRFLKPLTRKHRFISYRESFQQRMLRPVGIPIQNHHHVIGDHFDSVIGTLHELFQPSMRYYSPLYGMIFTYNNGIDNLYRYGNSENDPSVTLIRMLFHSLPGGEIQATHLTGTAAAHLSPAVIGVVLEAVASSSEKITSRDVDHTENHNGNLDVDVASKLADILLDIIVNHPDYQQSQRKLTSDLEHAQQELEALYTRDRESQSVRDTIKQLEGDVIKRGRHVIKRLQKSLAKTKNVNEIANIQQTIACQEDAMQKAEQEVEHLRQQIVTGDELKAAKKALQRAKNMIEMEEQSRKPLADAMALSFCSFELDILTNQSPAPKFMTIMALLGYIWRKYDSIEAIEGYLQSMERIGALTCSAKEALEKTQRPPDDGTDSVHRRLLSRRHKKWTAKDVADAVAIMIAKPGVARRPPIVPFSYVSWSSYSKFPDCGEKALHNLFNQILFNPSTGNFDFALLLELKQTFYPNLEQKLIEFYRRHPSPQEALEHEVAKDWIEVTSFLNKASRQGPSIRYRREKQQQNIASPLSNAMRVFNALLGIEPLDRVCLEEVVQHINSLRGWTLKADSSHIKPDGFGIIEFSDGNVYYELQSYKPVHFGFVQVKTLGLDAIGLRDYKIFQKFAQYAALPLSRQDDESIAFEKLALSSLLIPYDIQRRKMSRFLQKYPSHYEILFADANGLLERQNLLKWCERHAGNDAAAELMKGIQSYKEPTYMPLKKSAEAFDDE